MPSIDKKDSCLNQLQEALESANEQRRNLKNVTLLINVSKVFSYRSLTE